MDIDASLRRRPGEGGEGIGARRHGGRPARRARHARRTSLGLVAVRCERPSSVAERRLVGSCARLVEGAVARPHVSADRHRPLGRDPTRELVEHVANRVQRCLGRSQQKIEEAAKLTILQRETAGGGVGCVRRCGQELLREAAIRAEVHDTLGP